MTFDELVRDMLEIFPQAEVLEDNDGQLIVYTGKKLRDSLIGERPVELVVDFEEPEVPYGN